MVTPAAALDPPSAATTVAVLLGASEYPLKPKWTNPVLGTSASAVRDYLTSPHGFDLPAARFLDLFDSDAGEADQLMRVGEFLAAAGRAARDLVLYYVGHGGFDNREYYLGIRNTRDDQEYLTTIESRKLAKVVRAGFSHKRLYVIMDACFAGSAISDWQGDEAMAAVRNLEKHLPREGTVFLAAASKYDVTLAPRAEQHTIFTGALLETLRRGINNGAAGLSMHDLYDEIRYVLQQREAGDEGRPELHVPSQRDGDISQLALFPNPYTRALEARRAQEAAREEAARIETERAEAARQKAARAEAARQAAARDEAALEAGRRAAARATAWLKEAAAREEAARQEAVRNDLPRDGANGLRPSREPGGHEPPRQQSTAGKLQDLTAVLGASPHELLFGRDAATAPPGSDPELWDQVSRRHQQSAAQLAVMERMHDVLHPRSPRGDVVEPTRASAKKQASTRLERYAWLIIACVLPIAGPLVLTVARRKANSDELSDLERSDWRDVQKTSVVVMVIYVVIFVALVAYQGK